MKIADKGVVSPSYFDFTAPSEFARQNLYWVPQYGRFYCNRDYLVNRSWLDLFLFIYVADGSLSVETRGYQVRAQKDQIVLLDCHYPHKYYCEHEADILWIHFNGNNSQAYADYLYEKNGILFAGEHIPPLKSYFSAVLASSHTAVSDEHRTALHIMRILCGLAAPASPQPLGHHLLEPAIAHMREHYPEELSLETLSALCGLSVSHFIRMFRKYMECTPHQYLLSFRLRRAKQLLLSTSDSIDEISAACGFNSASHFARAFRRQEGITPTEFRNAEILF